MTTLLYCLVREEGMGYRSFAITGDGETLYDNWSTKVEYIEDDLKQGRDIYNARFPEGWQFEWIDDEHLLAKYAMKEEQRRELAKVPPKFRKRFLKGE